MPYRIREGSGMITFQQAALDTVAFCDHLPMLYKELSISLNLCVILQGDSTDTGRKMGLQQTLLFYLSFTLHIIFPSGRMCVN